MSGNPAVADDDEDDIPLAPAGGKAQATERAEPDTFEIVDVADDFDPRSVATDPGQGVRADEEETVDAQPEETSAQRQTREREAKAKRRQRQHDARDRTISENRAMQARIAELEEMVQDKIAPRLDDFDKSRAAQVVADIERQLDTSNDTLKRAKRALSEAMIAQDADAMNAALDERDQAFIAVQQLTARKQMLEQTGRDPLAQGGQPRQSREGNANERPAAQAPRPLPRVARDLMSDFQSRHDWIDARRDRSGAYADDDTAILMRLDNAVARDGFDPSTPEYWDELEDRAARYLPHRFKDAPQATAKPATTPAARPAASERRGPLVGGGNQGSARRPEGNKVYLSAGRKTALIQAGVLEPDGRTVTDAAKFRSYLKKYDEFDRANGGAVRQ